MLIVIALMLILLLGDQELFDLFAALWDIEHWFSFFFSDDKWRWNAFMSVDVDHLFGALGENAMQQLPIVTAQKDINLTQKLL